jgi:hypothetical protein
MTTDDILLWSPEEACCSQCVHYLPPYPDWNVPAGCRILPDPDPAMTVTYCVEYTPCVPAQDAAAAPLAPDAVLAAPSAAEADQQRLTDTHAGQGTTSPPRVPDPLTSSREGRDTFFLQKNEATK